MSSKILSFLALFLVVSMASARRGSSQTSTNNNGNHQATFVARHRRVSIPKLFDNRQVIANMASSKIRKNESMNAEEYSERIKKLHNQDELVYLSFHGF